MCVCVYVFINIVACFVSWIPLKGVNVYRHTCPFLLDVSLSACFCVRWSVCLSSLSMYLYFQTSSLKDLKTINSVTSRTKTMLTIHQLSKFKWLVNHTASFSANNQYHHSIPSFRHVESIESLINLKERWSCQRCCCLCRCCRLEIDLPLIIYVSFSLNAIIPSRFFLSNPSRLLTVSLLYYRLKPIKRYLIEGN